MKIPKSRASFRKVVVLLLVFSMVILAVRNFDQAIFLNDSEPAGRSRAVRNTSSQSILDASRAQQKPLDWKQLCEIADEESGRNWQGWNARGGRYARRLKTFTVDELVDLLADITNLSCSDTATAAISNLVLGAIIEKQQSLGFSLALAQYKGNYGWGVMMSAKFREWVEMDPRAAELWLIQQDWGNSAETPQPPLIDMGSALLCRHLNQDIDQAGLLVVHLPMASRYEIIKYGFANCERVFDDARAAALIRQSLPLHEQPRMFGEVYAPLGFDGDYQKIERVIEAISASEEERNEIVVAVSKARMQMGTGKPPQESLDEIRGWVAEQSPAVLDRTTGEIFSIMYHRDFDHKATEDFILKYHDAGASDEMITAFLESSGSTKTPETIKRLKAQLRAEITGDSE